MSKLLSESIMDNLEGGGDCPSPLPPSSLAFTVPLKVGPFPAVCFFYNFKFYSGVWPINNVVIVSGGQQRDCIYVSILPQTPLPPHDIEQSFMFCIAGPCWGSIFNIAVCTCPVQTP